MANDISIDLRLVPLAVLHGAFKKAHPALNWTTKAAACDYMASQIRQGYYTLSDVKAAQPLPLPTASSVANGIRDVIDITQQVAPVAAVANRAEQNALDAQHRLSLALDRIDILEQGAPAIEGALQAIGKTIEGLGRTVEAATKIDPAIVAGQVTAAVRDAFKPFAETVAAAGAQAAIGAMVAVSKVQTVPVSQAFGVAVMDALGREMMVDLYDDTSSPAIDPSFIWTEGILRHLLLSQQTGENAWFGGDKGTGKTQTAQQFAARTGRGFVRVNFHKYTTSEDYIGAMGLENGATVFKDGDFLRAFTTPATVILLDEITNADPAALATLNGFLEPNSAVSYGGAVRRRAAGVLVFAADNTLTNGDDSGRYAGTRQMNSALADRFSRVIAFKHLDIADEIAAVVKHIGCTDDLAEHVLKAVHACRSKVASGDIIDAPSIRQVMAFIRAVPVLGVDEAWATAIGNRQPSESAAALETIKAAYLNNSFVLSCF